MRYLYIALGGALGALARWGMEVAIWPRADFPVGILIVNLSGSLLLGWLFPRTLDWGMPPDIRLGIVTGFFGAFTTFSTWLAGTMGLATGAHAGLAFLYVAVSLVGGVICALAGTAVARWMADRAEGGAADAG